MAVAVEPLVLPLGTEVSAKYRGAFCEAKVKKIVRNVKCKVSLPDSKQQITVTDEEIKGTLKAGSKVELKHPETGGNVEGTLMKLTDCSQYTVVFDDGDENTLRRTQLCLKGEKHFVKSETLDQLPLTHPEHFGTPVMKALKGQKRRRGAAQDGNGSDLDSESESSECGSPKKVYKGRLLDMLGRVVCMELEDRKKTNWVPGLVVLPSASDTELKTREHLLIKSFKDGRFYAIMRRETKDFTRDMAIKNEDKGLKPALEKALAYFDTRDLPSTWDREELLGEDSDDDEESETSDDEPSEEKDHFVAQLYKFMDDRGTPINKVPSIGSQDLNLYRLFKLVRNLGGYNKVTNLMKWKLVYSKMNLPASANAYNQIKTAYKKFLHAYEDFYRKLGSTMGNSRTGRTRHSSGRSLLPFREREAGQPKSPRNEKKDEKKESGEESETEDKTKVKDEKPKEAEKNKKEEKKSAVKEEPDEGETPRKRRRGLGIEKKEEEKEEKTSKRVTRDDVAKQKEEPKVKAEEERARRSNKKTESEEKEEVAAKRKSARKPKPKEEKEDNKKKEKEEPVSDGGPDEDSDEEGDDDSTATPPPPKEETVRKYGKMRELTMGTKLKVRYGRGKNQKMYAAKVLESQHVGNSLQYLVHYAGWNTRYDEWISRDRIVAVVSEGTDTDRKAAAAKTLKSPKSIMKKVARPKSGSSTPTPPPVGAGAAGKADTPKLTKGKTSAANTPSQGKGRPTRSSAPETALGLPPVRRRRRQGSAVGDSASDLQSHVSYSDSEDDDLADEKKVDTDDTDSLKAKSDKSTESGRLKTYSKLDRAALSKKAEKENSDLSESESESVESTEKEVKPRAKETKVKTKAEMKSQPLLEKRDDDKEDKISKSTASPGPKGLTPKAEKPEEIGLGLSNLMENKAKDLMNKDEDAQSEDDILKDLKMNHHIDMGDILMDSDTDMPIAPPKAKASKDNAKGKRRKSSDSADKCFRQDSMDTVAYGYDIQDAVQNILSVLDEGDDDSDDLSFLTPSRERKDILPKLEPEKKEEPKLKKDKKMVEKFEKTIKEKLEKTPKGKGKKKSLTGTPPALTEESKQDTDSDKEKKTDGDKIKIKKKKKVKKKLNDNEQDKDEKSTPELSEREIKPETVSSGTSNIEETNLPPQLNLVTPTKEKQDPKRTNEAESSPAPPKLQAERLMHGEKDKEKSDPVFSPPKPILSSVMSSLSPESKTSTTALSSLPSSLPTSQNQPSSASTPATITSSPSNTSTPVTATQMSSPSPSKTPLTSLQSSPAAITSPTHKVSHHQPPTSSTTPSKSPLSSPAKPAPVLSPSKQETSLTTASSTSSPNQAKTASTPPSSQLPSLPQLPASSPPPSSSKPSVTNTAMPSTPSTTASQEPTFLSKVSGSSPVQSASSSPRQAAAALAALSSPKHHGLFVNTPPETPEGSPEAEHGEGGRSPLQQPDIKTNQSKSKTPESGDRTFSGLLPGGESPNTCDTSTLSNGSEGSSGNMPSSEDSTEATVPVSSEKKRKTPSHTAPESQPQPKKRKRGQKRGQEKGKSTPKHTMSDSDEAADGPSTKNTESAKGKPEDPPPTTNKKQSGSSTPQHHSQSSTSNTSAASATQPRLPATVKYNLNLDEGQYLTGEPRINFLLEKLQEIRKIYMGLKAEVACIDRRKKRLKRREREKEGTALALASLANS